MTAAAPDQPRPQPAAPRASARSVLLRLLAAAAVIAAAIAVQQTILTETPAASDTRGSRVVDFELDSELIGEELPVEVVVPPGARDGKRSLLVFLHGRGADESSYLDSEMFRGLVAQRGKAPVVAFPRGDPDSYWHDRDSGQWGSYVLDELIPALVRRFDIEPERVAIGGISMGGYGAVHLAGQQPQRFCTVGGHSAAVWENAGDTAEGAFDDSDDFERNDVIDQVGPPDSPLAGKRVWLDVGDQDPFLEADRALEQALSSGGARGKLRVWPGAHEDAYWASHWRQYMRFYATQLKRCGNRAEKALKQEKAAEQAEEAGGDGDGGGTTGEGEAAGAT